VRVAVAGCVGARTVALLLGIKPGLGAQGARVATAPLRVAGGLVFHGVCQVCLAAATGRIVLEALHALEDGNGQFANCGWHGRVGLDDVLDDGVVARRELGCDDEAKGELQEHARLVRVAPTVVHDQLVDGVLRAHISGDADLQDCQDLLVDGSKANLAVEIEQRLLDIVRSKNQLVLHIDKEKQHSQQNGLSSQRSWDSRVGQDQRIDSQS
jgi:hypothetical protein